MVRKNLKCYNCRTLNCQEVSKQNLDVVMVCKNCGFAQNPDPERLAKLDDPNPEDWIYCIPLKGLVVRVPVGKMPDGYADANGNLYTREEYMKRYLIDPEIYWDFRKRGSPYNVTGFECVESAGPSSQTDNKEVKKGD